MEQVKALNALEPFLALSKSATSPRAAADLVMRATSAPNTFIFAELLEHPQIQALASSPEHSPALQLLRIFSHGTWTAYSSTPGLPVLSDAQARKLRQLSLLTLARDRASLAYDVLLRELGLSSARALENTVVSAVYAGLVQAKLDPAARCVRVSSVAPLRDLAPGAVPGMVAALRAWSDRCVEGLAALEAEAAAVRAAAAERRADRAAWEDRFTRLVEDEKMQADHSGGGSGGPGGLAGPGKKLMGGPGRRLGGFGKRGSTLMESSAAADPGDEAMDVDDDDVEAKRASRRKL
ncbi:hypothetical protein RB601_006741 [Gaeumannomyces tritici]